MRNPRPRVASPEGNADAHGVGALEFSSGLILEEDSLCCHFWGSRSQRLHYRVLLIIASSSHKGQDAVQRYMTSCFGQRCVDEVSPVSHTFTLKKPEIQFFFNSLVFLLRFIKSSKVFKKREKVVNWLVRRFPRPEGAACDCGFSKGLTTPRDHHSHSPHVPSCEYQRFSSSQEGSAITPSPLVVIPGLLRVSPTYSPIRLRPLPDISPQRKTLQRPLSRSIPQQRSNTSDSSAIT